MVDRVRLAQLCEMMRSDNDNERAVAARMATELLHRAGTTWTDFVLQAAPAAQSPKEQRPPPAGASGERQAHRASTTERRRVWEGADVDGIIRRVLDVRGLSPWEAAFVKALRAQNPVYGFTERQWRVLRDIASRHRLWG